MKKYNIVSIMGGSDLALNRATGSLVRSKRGDLMWQGKAHNAMFQFVRNYEMNEPKLKAQFAEILASNKKESELVKASNEYAEAMALKSLNEELIDGLHMHKLNNEHGSTVARREVNASSIFITLNNMLQVLKVELEIDQQKFLQSGPLYEGQSFGKIVWAASNNARHADEWTIHWVANKHFSKLQLKSVRVLAPVLGHSEMDYRFLTGNICSKILSIISKDDFETLERSLFTFANNLANRVENNKAAFK